MDNITIAELTHSIITIITTVMAFYWGHKKGKKNV